MSNPLGAALVMPTTLSIITNVFPPEERGRAVGVWAGVAGAGAMLGLLLSGILLRWFSWPSVFGLNVALAALALVLVLPIVPTSKSSRPVRLDPVGALLSSLGLFALVFSIIEAPQRGWLDTLTVAGFAAVLLAAAALVALLAPRHGDVKGADGEERASGGEASGRNHGRSRANRPTADAGAA